MAINYWRAVRYTDDGCTEYQCLACGERWEGRSGPGYGWKFCPYCGTLWDGERPQSKRLAKLERFYELRLQASMGRGGEEPRRPWSIGYWWVIEKRETWFYDGEPPSVRPWHAEREYDGRSSAAKILGELHHCRAVEPGFDDSFGVHRCKTEFRARIVRERPNQGYARNLGGGAWPGEGY